MGRSNLQGSAWHYEYLSGRETYNSKNCVFNTGKRCSCKISPNHNLPCVGRTECEEFERSSFRRKTEGKEREKKTNQVVTEKPTYTIYPDTVKIAKSKKRKAEANTSAYKKKSGKKNSGTKGKMPVDKNRKSDIVQAGSKVTVLSLDDGELIDLGTISSGDNPFYMRKLKDVVTVRGIRYRVEKID